MQLLLLAATVEDFLAQRLSGLEEQQPRLLLPSQLLFSPFRPLFFSQPLRPILKRQAPHVHPLFAMSAFSHHARQAYLSPFVVSLEFSPVLSVSLHVEQQWQSS